MEEEGANRRRYLSPGIAGPRRFLDGLDEDDEEESEEERGRMGGPGPPADVAARTHREKALPVHRDHGATPRRQVPSGINAATVSGNSRRTPRKGFELDLDGATLLNRRAGGGSGVTVSSPLSGISMGSPLRMEGLTVKDDLSAGSPMRVA